MFSFRTFVFRHALRALLLVAGAAALLDSPPVLSSGLPGPGLWPCLSGALLLLCALFLPANGQDEHFRTSSTLRRTLGLVLSSLLWIALLQPAGWLPATFLSALLACRTGGCSMKESLLVCILLSAVMWLGMEKLLRYSLPQGTLFVLAYGI